jgi:hypothetical protein
VGCGVSGMLWSVLCGGSGMGYLRSVVYLGSVVCEINGEGRQ